MLIAEFGKHTERFTWASRESDESDETEPPLTWAHPPDEPLGQLARGVLGRLEHPDLFTPQRALARLNEWTARLHANAIKVAPTPAIRSGLAALNAQLWAWARAKGQLQWADDPWNGPTGLLSSRTLTRARATVYAPPSSDGSRVFQLRDPFAALVTSTLEAVFTGNLGLCRSCSTLFLREPAQAARKRCAGCKPRPASATVEKACLNAIDRVRRRKDLSPREKDVLKGRCDDVRRAAANRQLTAAEAREELLRMAPRGRRGRPPKQT